MDHPIIGEAGGRPVTIDPHKLASGRLLLTAGSGGGKSYALRRILEQLYGSMPALVVDREGEYYTLREACPDYLIVGDGPEADFRVETRQAGALAVKLLEQRVSAVIDIEPLEESERYEYVELFAQGLIDAPKSLRQQPTLVVVDEANYFAPQVGRTECKDALIRLATLGRKRGLVPAFAAQRISALSKSIVAECHNRMIGLSTLDVDVKRSASELGFARARHDEIRRLRPGQFFCYGPALGFRVQLVQVAEVASTHGAMPPAAPRGSEAERAFRSLTARRRPTPARIAAAHAAARPPRLPLWHILWAWVRGRRLEIGHG